MDEHGSTPGELSMMGAVSLTDNLGNRGDRARGGARDADTPPDRLPASPRATRHRGRVWRDPRLLVGVVLVAASGLAGALVLTGDETVEVWAVRDGLTAGEPVRPDALVRREVRFADQADADRYLAADQPFPPDATLARDVGTGELLPRSALAEGPAPRLVEVPLRVASEAVPATVRTGSVVDVWVTPGPESALAGDGDPPEARVALSDVRVLAVSRGGTALGPAAERQVIVGVDAAQQRDLAAALADMAAGSVVLVRQP